MTLTTLCLDISRSQTCRRRSSLSSIQCRDHGKEVRHRITEVKVSNALSLSSEGLWRFCTWVYLFTDVSELGGDFSIFQFHVHGVAQQSQAASGPQHPVSLREELLPLKPMRRCHGRHQIHLTWPKRELFCRTLSGGVNQPIQSSTVFRKEKSIVYIILRLLPPV